MNWIELNLVVRISLKKNTSSSKIHPSLILLFFNFGILRFQKKNISNFVPKNMDLKGIYTSCATKSISQNYSFQRKICVNFFKDSFSFWRMEPFENIQKELQVEFKWHNSTKSLKLTCRIIQLLLHEGRSQLLQLFMLDHCFHWPQVQICTEIW